MLDLILGPAIDVFGTPMTYVEIFGFVTGVLCVWLLGRERVSNWPMGILQVTAYLFLFWDAGLYADSLLQVVYIALGVAGWANWLRRGPEGRVVVIRRTRPIEWVGLAAAGVAGTIAVWWVLTEHTDSTVAWADSLTTVLSLLATYGQVIKLLESWWIWIAADLIYIPLYFAKGLWLTAVLYTIFLGLCIEGLRQWVRLQREQSGLADPLGSMERIR